MSQSPRGVVHRMSVAGSSYGLADIPPPPPPPSRVYHTKHGKEYGGPAVPAIEPELVNQHARHHFAAFAGADGTLFDVNYVPLAAVPTAPDDAPGDVYNVRVLESGRVARQPELPEEPAPEDFERYEDYERALLVWAQRARAALSYVQLPRVTGRHLSRPKLAAAAAARRKESIDDIKLAATAGDDAAGDDTEDAVEEWLLPLKEDPWEAALVPAEPQPQFYEDFEQYEAAMRRWAIECSKLPRMPPSPAQLQELCQIRPARELPERARLAGGPVGLTRAAAVVQAQRAVRPPFVSPHTLLRTEGPMRLHMVESSWLSKASHKYNPETLSRLSADSRHKLQHAIWAIYKERETNMCENMSFNKPLALPEGVPTTTPKEIPIKLDWAQATKALADPLSSTYAKEVREDVEKYIYGSLSGSLVVDETAFQRNPEKAEFYNKAESQGSMLVTRRPFIFDDVLRVIRMPTHFCQFKRLLEVGSTAKGGSSWLSVMSPLVNMNNFPQLVHHWGNSRDPMTLAKLSYFIARVFRGNSTLYAPLRDSQDCKTLYVLAKCVHFAKEPPVDIYPYTSEVMPLLEQVFKTRKGIVSLISNIFVLYYTKAIAAGLQGGDPVLQATCTMMEQNIGDAIKTSPSLVKDNLFAGIRHRSVTVNSVCLFAFLQLMHSTVPTIIAALRSTDMKIIENIRTTCLSKFSHTQFACTRIIAALMEDSWREFFLNSYVNTDIVWDDLLNTKSKVISELAKKACMYALGLAVDENSADTVWGLFCEDAFAKLIKALVKTTKSPDHTTEAAAIVLNKICERSWELKFVQARSGGLKTAFMGRRTTHVLEIPISDRETSMIQTSILNLVANERSQHIRGILLGAFRVLLRHKGVFDIVKGDLNFFHKTLAWCKDGKSKTFNKNAWKLFYELIEYHAGVLDMLDKTRILTQFSDIISPEHGPIVATNALHYFGKLFTTVAAEQKRTAASLPVRRDDNKSIEKDLKSFISFFKERSLFVKLHMMYTRISPQQSSQAAVFQQLMHVFYLLLTIPECAKLAKELQKREEYRVGLQCAYSMFTGCGQNA